MLTALKNFKIQQQPLFIETVSLLLYYYQRNRPFLKTPIVDSVFNGLLRAVGSQRAQLESSLHSHVTLSRPFNHGGVLKAISALLTLFLLTWKLFWCIAFQKSHLHPIIPHRPWGYVPQGERYYHYSLLSWAWCFFVGCDRVRAYTSNINA